MAEKTITIDFKQGDTFRIDSAVRDRTSNAAKIAAAIYAQAENAYNQTLKADPIVEADVNAAYTAYTQASSDYIAAITVDITDWQILCQVRHGTDLIDTLTISAVDALAGTYSITATAEQTVNWPATLLRVDIELSHSSFGVDSSDTFFINVEKDVSRAES